MFKNNKIYVDFKHSMWYYLGIDVRNKQKGKELRNNMREIITLKWEKGICFC